jgi:tetratricopeptide (TPR) repeat protein
VKDTNLEACVIRVDDGNGRTQGAGFIVAPSLAVTCAHVVEACRVSPGEKVRVGLQAGGTPVEAEVLVDGWHPEADVAFLRLPETLPPGVTPAVLRPSAGLKKTQVRAFGYPKVGKVEGLWGPGELVDHVTETDQATKVERVLMQLRSAEITVGFSGGPVWDEETGWVIGMITDIAPQDRYGKLEEVAFAVPAETLHELRTDDVELQSVPSLPEPPSALRTSPIWIWLIAVIGAAFLIIEAISNLVGLQQAWGSAALVCMVVLAISTAALWFKSDRLLAVLYKGHPFNASLDWGWIVAGVAFPLAAVMLVSALLRGPPSEPTLDGSEFNIAIAQFSQGPEGKWDSVTGTEMAYRLRDELRSALSDLGYSPERVDVEVYDTVGAQPDRAAKLLDEVTSGLPEKAVSLLVYGYVPVGREDSYVVYFLIRSPQEAMELGDALSDEVKGLNPEEGNTDALADRTEVLILFSTGLVRLYTGQLSGALDRLEKSAIQAEALGLDEALDTLFFFQGRTLAALDQPESAALAYTKALTCNGQYAMAHIGLGNLYYDNFARAYREGESVDCSGLDAALEEYVLALESESTHYAAWVHGKANVNIGNTYSLCGQISGERRSLEQAVDAYTQALEIYKQVNARTEYLALAYYTRGIAHERLELCQSAEEDYAWCAENAGTRIGLATDCSKRLELIRSQCPSKGEP